MSTEKSGREELMDALAELCNHMTDLVGGLEVLCEIHGVLMERAATAAAGSDADTLGGISREDLAVLLGLLPFTPTLH